jgi:hypothetical protein
VSSVSAFSSNFLLRLHGNVSFQICDCFSADVHAIAVEHAVDSAAAVRQLARLERGLPRHFAQ